MNTNTKTITTFGLLATLAAASLAPALADPSSQQKNKNNWRNLGIAGALVAGYGLLKHDNTATLLGAAGAAYSANRYETDRKHQSQDSSNRRYYYRTNGWHPPYGSNGYGNDNNYNNNNGQYNNNNGQYGGSGYQPTYYGNGYNDNRNNGNNGYDRNGNGYSDNARRQDRGRHQDQSQHHDGDGDQRDRN